MSPNETSDGQGRKVETKIVSTGLSLPMSEQLAKVDLFASRLCTFLQSKLPWNLVPSFNNKGQLILTRKLEDAGVIHPLLMRNYLEEFLVKELHITEVPPYQKCTVTEENVPEDLIEHELMNFAGRIRSTTDPNGNWTYFYHPKGGLHRESIIGIPIPWAKSKNDRLRDSVRGSAALQAQINDVYQQLSDLWNWIFREWDTKIEKQL